MALPDVDRGTSNRGIANRGTNGPSTTSGSAHTPRAAPAVGGVATETPPWQSGTESQKIPYPIEVTKLSTWLIRQGYVMKVSKLLPVSWRSMSEQELTVFLKTNYPEEKLVQDFAGLAAEREALKGLARKGGVIAAFVVGLIWARENVKNNEWDKAIAKLALPTLSAVLINRLLYARDPVAAQIMERNAGRFGKWFQGAARTNPFVNRLSELGMISLAATIGLSGGGEYPSIPFDLIHLVDIDDATTWSKPNQHLLDFGFNIWYQQKPTAAHPEAAEANVYLGTIYGSSIPIVYGVIYEVFLSHPAE
jgi:hypothetical protein